MRKRGKGKYVRSLRNFCRMEAPKCHRGLQRAGSPGGDGVNAQSAGRSAIPPIEPGAWERSAGGWVRDGGKEREGAGWRGGWRRVSDPESNLQALRACVRGGGGFPQPLRSGGWALLSLYTNHCQESREWSCRKCLRAGENFPAPAAARSLRCLGARRAMCGDDNTLSRPAPRPTPGVCASLASRED